MKEEAFRQQVRGIARSFGWMMYHTYDSRRSDPGFPDEVMVHPRRNRVLFVEFKNEKGKVTDAQWKWLNALALGGQEVAVWRPQHMDRIVQVLDANNHCLRGPYWTSTTFGDAPAITIEIEKDGWEFPEHLRKAMRNARKGGSQ